LAASDLIIAARPAMGKTAFVLSMARNMAIDYGMPSLIFTRDGICTINNAFDFV
jgi:replicative DNA helicase